MRVVIVTASLRPPIPRISLITFNKPREIKYGMVRISRRSWRNGLLSQDIHWSPWRKSTENSSWVKNDSYYTDPTTRPSGRCQLRIPRKRNLTSKTPNPLHGWKIRPWKYRTLRTGFFWTYNKLVRTVKRTGSWKICQCLVFLSRIANSTDVYSLGK